MKYQVAGILELFRTQGIWKHALRLSSLMSSSLYVHADCVFVCSYLCMHVFNSAYSRRQQCVYTHTHMCLYMSRGAFAAEILENKTLNAAAEVADKVKLIIIFVDRSIVFI